MKPEQGGNQLYFKSYIQYWYNIHDNLLISN